MCIAAHAIAEILAVSLPERVDPGVAVFFADLTIQIAAAIV